LISEEKLTLLYQLQIASFPQEVIENAKKRIAKLEGINLIQKESFTGEQRQKIVIEGGEIIGDYLEKIKRLENISDDK
jgi:hypothetical protein